MSKAAEILEAGAGHMKDRAQTYDSPEGERSMEKCVRMFNALTGHDMSAEQGWHFMTCLKMVRSQQGGYRADNYEDGAAYFALAGEQAEQDRTAPPPKAESIEITDDMFGVCETPQEPRWLCRNAVSELAERALEEAWHKPVTGYWHQCRCGNGFESASEFAHCRHCNGETTGRVRRG